MEGLSVMDGSRIDRLIYYLSLRVCDYFGNRNVKGSCVSNGNKTLSDSFRNRVSGFARAGGVISGCFCTGGKAEQSADLVCVFECCHGFGCLCTEKSCWCHRDRNRCL